MGPDSAPLRDAYAHRILMPDEPPPFEIVNAEGRAPLLLVCDHASNYIPRSLDQLGVPPDALERHVAYDIGSADLTRRLAARFSAPAVFGCYSRLVIDINRFPDDPTSIMKVSDGVVVPGNHDVSEAQATRRAEEVFYPYHRAVAGELDRIRRRGDIPVLMSVHSFTPVFAGIRRPWHVGVLWHEDPRIARPLLDAMRADPDLCVGENEPYHARKPLGYTVVTHAETVGLPHVLLEIRQDLIRHETGVAEWAQRLGDALEPILADPGMYELWGTQHA